MCVSVWVCVCVCDWKHVLVCVAWKTTNLDIVMHRKHICVYMNRLNEICCFWPELHQIKIVVFICLYVQITHVTHATSLASHISHTHTQTQKHTAHSTPTHNKLLKKCTCPFKIRLSTPQHKTSVNLEFYRVAISLEPKPVCGTLFMEFP